MIALVPFIENSCDPLVRASKALAPFLVSLCNWPLSRKVYTVADFAVSVGVVGIACVYWACWMHARLGNFRIASRFDRARDRAIMNFQEMLMDQSSESIAVLSSATRQAQYFAEGETLFEACKSGPDAEQFSASLKTLQNDGTAFTLSARTGDDCEIEIHGTPLGGRCVLYLRKKDGRDKIFADLLNALPLPVWLRDADLALHWANRAYLDSVGVEKLESALASNLALDHSESVLAATALMEHKPIVVTQPVVMQGQRKSLELNLIPLHGQVGGMALDVTQATKLEAGIRLMADTHAEMMDRLPFAMAVFDTEQRLVSYNDAYARLWELPEEWLDEHPTQDRILDRLREGRRLPEQRNFNAWKQEQLKIFSNADRSSEEFWHPPGGKSLRVLVQPHLQGGVFVLFEDVSERIHLAEQLTMLTQVQRATLDSLDEGVAIFGTDGRLVLHNNLFAKMWLLGEEELAGKPHFAEIANLCSQRIGRDGIWGVVSCGVNSAQPERLGEWGKAVRADGRTISLALARLPNGATSVIFTDLTDMERFNAFQSAGSHVAA